ncbi:uncharacterized protein LOC101457406 [Ceratitis capitata]|uniref:(Mediterranean fruit fly) hypothetical protein n=1 Tax=Ceratitis capitata TaxID=7213 RepID=W8BUX9_CERCA|nr:uncharacterized protein LOC101457406 [Ceratitis capitata]CAD7006332.1 unnamed protein product [Ceratitis capitata]
MKITDERTLDGSQRNPQIVTQRAQMRVDKCESDPFEQAYSWYPTHETTKHLEYVRRLESEFTCLQRAVLTLTTQFARVQFRIRQILQAEPCERYALLIDLEQLVFNGDAEENNELPPIQRDAQNLGDVRRKQDYMLNQLHQKLSTLENAPIWKYPPAPVDTDSWTGKSTYRNSTVMSSADSEYSTSSKSKIYR